MPLQFRLRHALGERVLEIPPHPVDHPFVIGRGAEAGLIVPSPSIAPRQCVLFVHEGRWVAQEWKGNGTKLNGKPLEKPTRLRVGDVLSFGTEDPPATLEIDPVNAAAGKRGAPAMEVAQDAAPQAPAGQPSRQPAPPAQPSAPQALRPRPRPAPPRPSSLTPMPTAQSSQPAAVAGATSVVSAAQAGEAEAADWTEQLAAASAAAPSRPRKKKQSSPVPIVIAIVLGVAIIGGTGWLVNKRLNHPTTVVIGDPGPAKPAKPKPIAPPKSNASAPPLAPANPPDPSDPTAAAVPTTSPAAEEDPDHAKDPDWTDVMVAHDLPDQAAAIVRYDDYRRRNPGKNERILAQYEMDALDRMWWRRVSQLCHRRTRFTSEIAIKDKEISTETAAAAKATLQADRASLARDRQTADDSLRKEMGYTADDPPDPDSEQAVAAARVQRNADKFAEWSKDVEHYARLHSGTSPWGTDDQ
jgi:hypothetical protein